MIFEEETQKDIKKTAINLIKKHRNVLAKHGALSSLTDELAIHHAIVSVNQILAVVSTDWGCTYWGEVRKVIKGKMK